MSNTYTQAEHDNDQPTHKEETMHIDWQRHHANIAVAINKIYAQAKGDRETVRLVAESVADTLERNPSFDRARFLYVATYTGWPSGYRPVSVIED